MNESSTTRPSLPQITGWLPAGNCGALLDQGFRIRLHLAFCGHHSELAAGSTVPSCLGWGRGNTWDSKSMYTCFCPITIRRTHA